MNQVSLIISGKVTNASRHIKHLNNIKMMVFDMAGTTINEGGMVYTTLFKTLQTMNLDVRGQEIDSRWHGINKYEVMDYYLYKTHGDNSYLYKDETYSLFTENIINYYSNTDTISLMDDNIPDLFNNFRERNIKICLNTGYSCEIQELLINKFNIRDFVDDCISSEDVSKGRPYPYMIHSLMERNGICNTKEVIKIGDTRNDMLEGINAGCHSAGVLSGVETSEELYLNNDVNIIDSVMHIK